MSRLKLLVLLDRCPVSQADHLSPTTAIWVFRVISISYYNQLVKLFSWTGSSRF